MDENIQPLRNLSHPLWFNGPPWLIKGSELWSDQPKVLHMKDICTEQRSNPVIVTANVVLTPNVDLFSIFSYSSFFKPMHVVSWCRRWIPKYRRSGVLTTTELKSSLLLMVKLAQADRFSKEIGHLMKKKVINKKSNVIALDPFLDKDGVLRVAGRLDLSQISYN